MISFEFFFGFGEINVNILGFSLNDCVQNLKFSGNSRV